MKSVWTLPDNPFLGAREPLSDEQILMQTGIRSMEVLGDYKWLSFKQCDDIVDRLSKSLITRKLCPLVRSYVEGTPDMKFIGIFSENRKEWFLTELAALSDSIVTVPISVMP